MTVSQSPFGPAWRPSAWPAVARQAAWRARLSISTRWAEAGSWLFLAALGQAATLRAIDAGPRLHYQHYRLPLELVLQGRWVVLLILTVQTALVAAACVRHAGDIRCWWAEVTAKGRLVAAAVLVSVVAAPVSRQVGAFAAELLWAVLLQLLHLATLALAVAAVPREVVLGRGAPLLGRRQLTPRAGWRRFIDPVVAVGAVWVTVVSAVLAWCSYERHPHVPDEVAYVLQARHLAAGMLAAPAPPVPAGFELYLMRYDAGRWYGVMPPGFPAVLTIGELAGAAWLVNPLLGGLNVVLIAMLIRRLAGRRASRLTVLLLAASPWVIFLAMSFMSHTLTVTWTVLATLALLRARRTGRPLWGAAAGACVAAISYIRPLDAVIVAALLGLWALGLGGRRLRIGVLTGIVAGGLAAGCLHLPYNSYLTGTATASPVMTYMNEVLAPCSNALGFGPDRGAAWGIDPFPGHGLRDAVVNAQLNLFSLNTELYGWPTGSLGLIAAAVLLGRWGRRQRLMAAVILAVIGAYSLYWFSGGPDFGARYWYLILVPCLLLTVHGIPALARCLGTPARYAERRNRLHLAVMVLCLMTVVNYLPWRAVDKYHHYLHMRPQARACARQPRFTEALILVRGQAHPDYASVASYNPLDFQGSGPVWAWDRDVSTRRALLAAYPHRLVWFISGPSLTGDGYRMEAGPLSAAEAETWRPGFGCGQRDRNPDR